MRVACMSSQDINTLLSYLDTTLQPLSLHIESGAHGKLILAALQSERACGLMLKTCKACYQLC